MATFSALAFFAFVVALPGLFIDLTEKAAISRVSSQGQRRTVHERTTQPEAARFPTDFASLNDSAPLQVTDIASSSSQGARKPPGI